MGVTALSLWENPVTRLIGWYGINSALCSSWRKAIHCYAHSHSYVIYDGTTFTLYSSASQAGLRAILCNMKPTMENRDGRALPAQKFHGANNKSILFAAAVLPPNSISSVSASRSTKVHYSTHPSGELSGEPAIKFAGDCNSFPERLKLLGISGLAEILSEEDHTFYKHLDIQPSDLSLQSLFDINTRWNQLCCSVNECLDTRVVNKSDIEQLAQVSSNFISPGSVTDRSWWITFRSSTVATTTILLLLLYPGPEEDF